MNSIRQIVIFLGAPGSGKGTLSKMCEDKLGWKQLSTGDLCRSHIEQGTEIGKEIDFTIKSGKLVHDTLIIEMVTQWLEKHKHNFETIILDGFPRTVVQAEYFIHMMQTVFSNVILKVYQLIVPDNEIIERLSKRVVCSNKDCQTIYSERVLGVDWYDQKCDICGSSLHKRSDDASEKISIRLDNYYYHITKLLEFYKSMNITVIDIQARESADKVFQEVVRHESDAS